MPINIDGVAVLRAIALSPKLFPDAAPEINNFARKYVGGQLKSAAIDLERLRDIHRAIGGEAFVLILDGLTDSTSTALLKKLDKENPELKAASPVWCRKRLAELASGASEPARKPPMAPKREPKGERPALAHRGPALTQEEKELAAALKKAINLEKARGLWRQTGEASFTLVLAGLTEKQTLGLAKRLDMDNPNLISARQDQLRQRIADLARGTAEPVFKNILEYSSMKVTRTRTPKVK